VIDTHTELREAFLMLKLPPDLNEMAMLAWDRALSEPSPQLIWKFFQMAGADRHFKDLEVNWGEAHRSYLTFLGLE